MAQTDLITCIYCKQQRPPSKEHALQQSLGGNLITRDVCEPCNTGFSTIDQALADRSLVTFTRLADTPKGAFDVKIGSRVTHTTPEGIVLEMTISNEYQPVILPQLHMRRDQPTAHLNGDREGIKSLVAYVDKHIADNTIGQIRTVEDPSTDTAAIVLHRKKEAYLRVPATSEKEWFIQRLSANWITEIRPAMTGEFSEQTAPAPELHIRLAYDINSVYRAIAKIAFNTLAIARGTALVLCDEFDPIRDYIRGDIRYPAVTAADQVAVDQRFVKMILPKQQVFAFGPGHTVVFTYDSPRLLAFVTLYGQDQFLITFPPIAYEEQEQAFGHQFSTDRTTNRALSQTDVYHLLLEARPNFLGPNTKKALDMLSKL